MLGTVAFFLIIGYIAYKLIDYSIDFLLDGPE